MRLYPRLPRSVARALAAQYATTPPRELIPVSSVSHRAAVFAPTGGQHANTELLTNLQAEIRSVAAISGYPDSSTEDSRRRFDSHAAQRLHELMDASAAEASHESMWAFFGCVLVPDVVRWRYGFQPGPTVEERFVGGFRGLRNTFGRLWWRAHILHDPSALSPYELVGKFGEDELVQITERPNLAGSSAVAQQVARSFLATSEGYPEVPRSELLRDSMKRLHRLLPIVSFDALEPEILKLTIDDVFAESARAQTRTGVSTGKVATRPQSPVAAVRERVTSLFHR